MIDEKPDNFRSQVQRAHAERIDNLRQAQEQSVARQRQIRRRHLTVSMRILAAFAALSVIAAVVCVAVAFAGADGSDVDPLAMPTYDAVAKAYGIDPEASDGGADSGSISLRVYSGPAALINEENVYFCNGLTAGERVNLMADSLQVQMSDEALYAKGICTIEELLDADTAYAALVSDFNFIDGELVALGDETYVLAYGLSENRVECTLRCLDTAGRELAEPLAFFNDIGDETVLTAPYFEGCIPEAYAIEKKISDDEEENVFTFIYHRLEEGCTTSVDSEGLLVVHGADGSEAVVKGVSESSGGDSAFPERSAYVSLDGAMVYDELGNRIPRPVTLEDSRDGGEGFSAPISRSGAALAIEYAATEDGPDPALCQMAVVCGIVGVAAALAAVAVFARRRKEDQE